VPESKSFANRMSALWREVTNPEQKQQVSQKKINKKKADKEH